MHQEWQTEKVGLEAKRLLESMTTKFIGQPVLFWNDSSRGHNGYLKVDLQGMEFSQVNKVFTRLENDFQRFLAFCENLADFEIKGKIGYLDDNEAYNWKQYGKLPIHSPDWNFARLEEFKNKPIIPIRRLMDLCETIEAQIPQDVLDRHKEFKKSQGEKPKQDGDWFLVTPRMEKALLAKYGEGWRFRFIWQGSEEATWLHRSYYQPGKIPEPMTTEEWLETQRRHKQPHQQQQLEGQAVQPLPEPRPQEQPVVAPKAPLKINIKLVDLASEPDSFERQKEALFRYARYLKRVPTVEEAMQYIRDKRLFTGSWEENLSRRTARVSSIVKWIDNTFDASKCAKGSVNVGKFDEWAKKKFPNGLIYRKCKEHLTEEGEVIERHQNVHVSTKFIACFMAIAEFTLLIDKNQDDTVPGDRGEELWKALFAKGLLPVRFCYRKWAACRDALDERSIIRITNRHYSPGKAMEWDVDRFFPGLGLWKGKKHRGPGGLPTKRKRTTTTRHNTWLRMQPRESTVLNGWTLPRPPPGGKWL
jgi:hypothetical protein